MTESNSKRRKAEARERVAAARAAQQRASRARRLRVYLGSSVAVVVVVAAIVVVGVVLRGNTKASDPSATPKPAAASLVRQVTGVSQATLASVGSGTATALVHTSKQPLLKIGGKPGIVYVGAEYCPFCAAERWAMIQALSHFGTFTGLYTTHSAPAPELVPDTPTFTFLHAKYTSKYISFAPDEIQGLTDNSGVLQKPTALQKTVFEKYDNTPYTNAIPGGEAGAYPFVDFGNQYLVIGETYNSSEMTGLTHANVAGQLDDPASTIAKGVDGAANELTAAICAMDGGKPTNVCVAPQTQSGLQLLSSGQTVNG